MARPSRAPEDVFVDRLKSMIPEGEGRSFSARSGLTEATLSRWRSGSLPPNPQLRTLKRIAATLRVSVAQLLSDESEPPGNGTHEEKGQEWEHLPLVGWAAAGSPHLYVADSTRLYAFHREWIDSVRGKRADKDRLCVVRVTKGHHGESMQPTIRPGALLVVDRGPRGEGLSSFVDGKIYLVRPPDDGGLAIKRAHRAGRSLVFNSDNREVPPFAVDIKGRSLKDVLVGRVVWIGEEEP